MKLTYNGKVYYDGQLFRPLDPEDEAKFRQWARANYKAGDPVSPLWHPVVRNECDKINREAGLE